MAASRLDKLLVERGLAKSRERARALILAGRVFVGGRRVDKAGRSVKGDAEIEVRGPDHPFVSRGGLKLGGALDGFGIDPAGMRCLDVGISTGGFTDCLLSRGAARVVGVDVGYGQLAWKLFPFAQQTAKLPKGQWTKVRVDVGDTFANVYVNGATSPCYTVRHLPFNRGGIRFWNYAGSGYFRNLKVTALADGEIVPVLDDPWTAVIETEVLDDWDASPLLAESIGKDEALAELSSGVWDWADAPVDVRGVVTVSAMDGGDALKKGVVLARTIVHADADGSRMCRLTYTDQLAMWVNGVEVFRGDPRGWFDPGRSEEDWFGRLIPDQFAVELSLDAGENEILVRHEVNEPLFGSGFWIRLDGDT